MIIILERRGPPYFFEVPRKKCGKAQFYWLKETRGQSSGLQEEIKILIELQKRKKHMGETLKSVYKFLSSCQLTLKLCVNRTGLQEFQRKQQKAKAGVKSELAEISWCEKFTKYGATSVIFLLTYQVILLLPSFF